MVEQESGRDATCSSQQSGGVPWLQVCSWFHVDLRRRESGGALDETMVRVQLLSTITSPDLVDTIVLVVGSDGVRSSLDDLEDEVCDFRLVNDFSDRNWLADGRFTRLCWVTA